MSNPSTNDTTPTTTGDAGEPTTIFPGRPLPSLGNGEDMQGLVSGVLVATFVIATLFILVRMYCKLLRYRALTFDDYILLGAWVRTCNRMVATIWSTLRKLTCLC